MYFKYFAPAVVGLFFLILCSPSFVTNSSKVLNLDYDKLASLGAVSGFGFLEPVNDSIAIAQFGMVDFLAINYKNGNQVYSIDRKNLYEKLERLVFDFFDENHYIPDQNEYLEFRRYGGLTPFDFGNILFYPSKEKYATYVTSVVFNKLDISNQQLFRFILFFDENLNDMEVIPVEPSEKDPSSGLLSGGFFLGSDRMFTKLTSFQHQKSFDFLEFQFVDENHFKLVDSLNGILTSNTGYGTRFFTTFNTKEGSFLNLGTGLYGFKNDNIREGTIYSFPFDSSYTCLYIEPLNSDYWVGYFKNNRENESKSLGKLILMDSNLTSAKILDEFDHTQNMFSSFFVYDKEIYLMKYRFEDKKFYLLNYSNIL